MLQDLYDGEAWKRMDLLGSASFFDFGLPNDIYLDDSHR
jgi:hypothetical protein